MTLKNKLIIVHSLFYFLFDCIHMTSRRFSALFWNESVCITYYILTRWFGEKLNLCFTFLARKEYLIAYAKLHADTKYSSCTLQTWRSVPKKHYLSCLLQFTLTLFDLHLTSTFSFTSWLLILESGATLFIFFLLCRVFPFLTLYFLDISKSYLP